MIVWPVHEVLIGLIKIQASAHMITFQTNIVNFKKLNYNNKFSGLENNV